MPFVQMVQPRSALEKSSLGIGVKQRGPIGKTLNPGHAVEKNHDSSHFIFRQVEFFQAQEGSLGAFWSHQKTTSLAILCDLFGMVK